MTRRAVLAQLKTISERPPTREEQCLTTHNNRKTMDTAQRLAVALQRRNTERGLRPAPGLFLPPY